MAGDGVACRRCCGIPNGVARLDEALRTNGYSYNTTIGSDGGLPDKRGGGEDGLRATMIVAAPDDGIRSPSSLASAAAAAAVPTTAIPNGEWRDSKSSRGGGTARAAVDGDDLPGASAEVSGSGDGDDSRQGRTLTGKGREPA